MLAQPSLLMPAPAGDPRNASTSSGASCSRSSKIASYASDTSSSSNPGTAGASSRSGSAVYVYPRALKLGARTHGRPNRFSQTIQSIPKYPKRQTTHQYQKPQHSPNRLRSSQKSQRRPRSQKRQRADLNSTVRRCPEMPAQPAVPARGHAGGQPPLRSTVETHLG